MVETGRAVTDPKISVQEAYPFDILEVQREGLLHPGGTGMTGWRTSLGDTWGVRYFVEGGDEVPTHIWFDCPMYVPGTNKKIWDEWCVDLETTPCNFGRQRYWFSCPIGVDESGFSHRCRILYFVPGSNFPGCRKCHRLTYDCQRRHRELCYENLEKHRVMREKLKSFKAPRSPEQWVRRYNRMMAAHEGEMAGMRAMAARAP